MARHDVRNSPDWTKIIGLLCFVASILVQHGTSGQRVKVDPEVSSYPGQTVVLRCSFSQPDGVQITMVTWIYEPRETERINIAVLHPKYEPNYPLSPMLNRVKFTAASPDVVNPSIQITNLTMNDAGKYICEFASFPDGNEQGIIQLVMLAKPKNSASVATVVAGTQPTVVATCESADGRPPAKIYWVTTANGNGTTETKVGADNTVTVISKYIMVPKSSDNGKDISCVVEHRTQAKPESIMLKLAIQYLPEVTIEGYDNNWYMGRTNVVLTCQAKANPVPISVSWKTMSGEMPENVRIKDKELMVLKVDERVNATFVCEVKNRIGTTRDQVTATVRATRLPEKGPTTGTIIGAIIGVVLLVAIIGTVIAMYRKHKNNILNRDGPPKYKPPPPKKTDKSSREVNAFYTSVNNERPLQNQNLSTQNTEPVTDLDNYQDTDGYDDGVHYISAAPSGWDDPGNNEVPPPYIQDSDPHAYYQGPAVSRGDSFVSPAMFV